MKSKDVTLGGILIGITVVLLYSTSLLPVSTISILTVASCIVPICIMRSSVKTATFVYIGSSILSFFLTPINIAIMYTLFFGCYGIVKYFIEQKKNMLTELIYKFAFFNIVFLIVILLMIFLLSESVTTLPLGILWLIVQPAFLAYDYALTIIISWYLKRLHNKI